MSYKILHICQAPIGGTVEYLKLLLKNLDKKYCNTVICPISGNLALEMEKLNIKVENLEMLREISPQYDINHIWQLRRMIKRINPDIIYLHSSKAGVLGRIACVGLNKKVIYNSHGWSFTMNGSKNKKRFYAFIEKILAPFASMIINISDYELEAAVNYGLSSKKMITINNGTDLEQYSKYSEKKEYLDEFVIGFVGRLSEQKNPLFMVDIAIELRKRIDNFIFLVVGDGELLDPFKEYIKIEGLEDHFNVVGWQSEVGEYIQNFDVAIMISKWEGFGLVVTEYMSAKKPVVSVSVGGVSNIIENSYNGVMINDYNAKYFAEAILKLQKDSEYRYMLVNNGYKTVEKKFNIIRVVKEHEHLFEKLLN